MSGKSVKNCCQGIERNQADCPHGGLRPPNSMFVHMRCCPKL